MYAYFLDPIVQTDFFHVGGSSLLLLSLTACIRESINLDIPLIHRFESSTLGAMTRQIDNASVSDIEASDFDWNDETTIPPELVSLGIKNTQSSTYSLPKRNALAKVVVLTGATG